MGPRPPGRERPWSVLRHAFDGQNAHRALEAAGLQKVLAKDGLVLGGSGARQQLLLAVRKLAVVAVRAVAALRAERRTHASPCKMSLAKFERAVLTRQRAQTSVLYVTAAQAHVATVKACRDCGCRRGSGVRFLMTGSDGGPMGPSSVAGAQTSSSTLDAGVTGMVDEGEGVGMKLLADEHESRESRQSSRAARDHPRCAVVAWKRADDEVALRAAGRHVEKYISHPFNSAGATARQPAARGPGGTASWVHLFHSASASSSSPSVLCRFDCGSASSVPPASTSSSASSSSASAPARGGAGQRGSSRVALADAHTPRGVPGSSTPAVPPLTARFAAFSNDFCFSCSLYAAHDKEGESVTGC